MYRLFVIAKNNMKKQRGDMLTFFVLTFISGFLIFDCVAAGLGTGRVMDDCYEAVNGCHIIFTCPDNDATVKAAEKTFQDNEHIDKYEKTPVTVLTTKYRKKGTREFSTYEFYAEAFDEETEFLSMKRPVSHLGRNEIILPYNMKSMFAIGDTLQLKMDDDIYDMRVVGYTENPFMCSTICITIYSVIMDREMLSDLHDEHPNYVSEGYFFKIHADEKTLNASYGLAELGDDVCKDFTAEAKKYDDEKAGDFWLETDWNSMREGSSFAPLIFIAIVFVFSLLVLAIAVVIITFSIRNFIRKNMKNTGILEASGYTVNELRWALVFQMTFISLLGSICGVVLGITTFGTFGELISIVLGLYWNQPVDITAALSTVLGTLLIVAVVARTASSEYNKVSVLDALRGGINTHNFKKNLFSFEKTNLPVPVVFALKDTFGALGGSLIIALMIMFLDISTNVGFGLYESFGTDSDRFFRIFAMEVADAYVEDVGNGDYEEAEAVLSEAEGVEKVVAMYMVAMTLKSGDAERAVTASIYDDLRKLEYLSLTEGRVPETDNEILITTGISKDLGIGIGDVVSIKNGDDEIDFLVVGINQQLQNMGRGISLTMEGAEKVLPAGAISPYYYVYAKDGMTYETLSRNIYTVADDMGYDFSVIDFESLIIDTISSVFLVMKLISVLIVVITVFVVAFVESLIVRAKISREWKNMGVSKALGQTTGGLILQLMLSNIPTIFLGAVLGTLVSAKVGQTTMTAMFSLFEMRNMSFYLSPGWTVVTLVGIVLVAAGTAGIEGLRVRRLIPVEMITEE
ncbi:MAG: ABC transporter permease [Lachnospiraceae bacterium]|nr:ABC transporter permease [Lachnospiraceae bacterium]